MTVEISRRLHRDYYPAAEATLKALMQEYPTRLQRPEIYDPEPGDRSLGRFGGDGVISLNSFWFADPLGQAKLDAPSPAAARSSLRVPWRGTAESAASTTNLFDC